MMRSVVVAVEEVKPTFALKKKNNNLFAVKFSISVSSSASLAVFALGLTDLDLLDLGEILIAEDENNVAGFPSPFYNVAGFLILFVVLLKTMWQVF